jgi:hypothetical protein
MIIVKLIGGLGNQMFQYAAGLYLSQKYCVPCKLDIKFLLDKSKRYYRHEHRDFALDIFKINTELASDEEISRFVVPRTGNKYVYHLKNKILKSHNVYNEFDYGVLEKYEEIPAEAYIIGYWQDERYFAGIIDKVRQEFMLKEPLPESHEDIYNQICTTNSLCVVVRRGDYVGHPILDILTEKYYYRGIDLVAEITGPPQIFIFSDDIAWCKKNIRPTAFKTIYVDQKFTGSKAQHYFRLMTACKNYVIANSTYAWWGAWLSNNKDQVVVSPAVWYKGQLEKINKIVPSEWLTI